MGEDLKDSFILYSKYKEVFENLTDEQAGQLIKGIFDYIATGESGLNGLMTAVFTPIKQDLDRNNATYEAVCERNRTNGSKGGRPKKITQKTQSVILETQRNPKNLDNDYDNDNKKENILKEKRQIQFERFWELYPRKVKKSLAQKWFEKKKPDSELFDAIISSLEKFKESPQWTKDNGKFIPHPSTWLNQERWEDEIEEVKEQKTNAIFYDGAIQIL